MKKIFLLLLSFVCVYSFAEDPTEKTKIEQAINTKDFLFKQEVFSLDNLSAFRIDAVKITNLEKFNVVSGLKVVYKIAAGKELKTLNNYIDAEEIDGFISSLQYMKTILKSKTTPGSYTEIKYMSQSGFLIMLYTILTDRNKLDWSFSVQMDMKVDKSLLGLTNDDIDKLQKVFEQGKGKL
ncbi:MAG: hypothetical protein JWN78_2154 [Bacteroidota bacterium]|nr:hypothetical protein [Bacteroidota bacterium]